MTSISQPGDHHKLPTPTMFPAWLAGDTTDNVSSVSPVLSRFVTQLNDALGDADRQKLLPFLPRLVGTADDGHDEERAYLALDWLIRTYAPTWLDLAGLGDHAAALRGLDPIVDETTMRAAAPCAKSAWESACAGKRTAAGVAARAASGAAAWATTRYAAHPDEAEPGAVATAARAWLAARNADAAAADRASLRPTVEELRTSALDLLDRMLQVGEGA